MVSANVVQRDASGIGPHVPECITRTTPVQWAICLERRAAIATMGTVSEGRFVNSTLPASSSRSFLLYDS